jgi:hypothetical protein
MVTSTNKPTAHASLLRRHGSLPISETTSSRNRLAAGMADSQIRRNEPTSELRELKKKPEAESRRPPNEPITFSLEQKNA